MDNLFILTRIKQQKQFQQKNLFEVQDKSGLMQDFKELLSIKQLLQSSWKIAHQIYENLKMFADVSQSQSKLLPNCDQLQTKINQAARLINGSNALKFYKKLKKHQEQQSVIEQQFSKIAINKIQLSQLKIYNNLLAQRRKNKIQSFIIKLKHEKAKIVELQLALQYEKNIAGEIQDLDQFSIKQSEFDISQVNNQEKNKIGHFLTNQVLKFKEKAIQLTLDEIKKQKSHILLGNTMQNNIISDLSFQLNIMKIRNEELRLKNQKLQKANVQSQNEVIFTHSRNKVLADQITHLKAMLEQKELNQKQNFQSIIQFKNSFDKRYIKETRQHANKIKILIKQIQRLNKKFEEEKYESLQLYTRMKKKYLPILQNVKSEKEQLKLEQKIIQNKLLKQRI